MIAWNKETVSYEFTELGWQSFGLVCRELAADSYLYLKNGELDQKYFHSTAADKQ